ncbi:hypothetical protein EJB05_14322, partial [Eragrostis curvula]
MDGPAGDLDQISALPDNVLHVILGCLGYAPAVTRTAVLSRRWRHVWTGAKSLTFKDSKSDFAGFLDWVLAQRGDADMESLEIQVKEKCRASPEQLNAWLCYATRHVIKSVDIDLGMTNAEEQVVVEVPSHGRAESISLALPSNHRLQLPAATATARYDALTKLELYSPLLDEDGGKLSHFVASCCPRLRRLRLCGPGGLRHLVLRSDVLQEFAISCAMDLETLDVATPDLRVFELSTCFAYLKIHGNRGKYVDGTNNKLARIVAPKLEEIVSMHYHRSSPTELDIHDFASVRRLSELHLDMHGKYHQDMDVGFWLLESFPGIEHVDIQLRHMPRGGLTTDKLIDLTSEGKAPFPKLRTMAVRAIAYLKHHLVASMSALLVRCPNLTSLRVDMYNCLHNATWGCFCESVVDKWEIHGKVALESLEELKMTGFGGTEEEMQLVRLLFQSSNNSIKSMELVHASAAKIKYATEQPDVKDVETIYHELVKLPCADVQAQGHYQEYKSSCRANPSSPFSTVKTMSYGSSYTSGKSITDRFLSVKSYLMMLSPPISRMK